MGMSDVVGTLSHDGRWHAGAICNGNIDGSQDDGTDRSGLQTWEAAWIGGGEVEDGVRGEGCEGSCRGDGRRGRQCRVAQA